jgi:hypothetical protein
MQTPEEIAELKKAYKNGAEIGFKDYCYPNDGETKSEWKTHCSFIIKPTVTNYSLERWCDMYIEDKQNE